MADWLPGADWVAREQEALVVLPERIRVMQRRYGLAPGFAVCGKCRWFHRYHQGGRWAKCDKTVQTSGAGTDWRARWPACGLFEEAL